MIISFRLKGLRQLFETGKSKQIPADFSAKLILEMDTIHQADDSSQLNLPGYDLHESKGDHAGRWAMKVNKNGRLTFGFEGSNAVDLDLEDYH